MPTVSEFLTAALAEIRVARAGDVVGPDDMDLALFLFNELLDSLNADERALYVRTFATHTLTANLQPHTIGLAANSPTFSVSIGRPKRVISANLVNTSVSPNIRTPIEVRDNQWWSHVTAQAVTSSYPTDLNYRTGWPNGSIYLWPVPTTAYGLELETDTLLASVAITDTFALPFGYQQALRLTLAELLAPAFGQKIADSTVRAARDARGKVWGNNDTIPNAIPDAGVPTGARQGGWNYLTGNSE